MMDLGVTLNALRADFRTVAAWCLDCGEWSDADVEEIGQAIKAAVEGDAGYLAFWVEWMERIAGCARANMAQLRANEREAEDWWAEQQKRAAGLAGPSRAIAHANAMGRGEGVSVGVSKGVM